MSTAPYENPKPRTKKRHTKRKTRARRGDARFDWRIPQRARERTWERRAAALRRHPLYAVDVEREPKNLAEALEQSRAWRLRESINACVRQAARYAS